MKIECIIKNINEWKFSPPKKVYIYMATQRFIHECSVPLCNSPTLESFQKSTYWWMVKTGKKQNTCGIHAQQNPGINKKEGTTDSSHNMDSPQEHWVKKAGW